MKVIDSYKNHEEVTVQSENLLRELLTNISAQDKGVIILASPDNGSLTIGLTNSYGFVEYMNNNKTPPYLIATDPERQYEDVFLEFDSGGSNTEIPASKCLPIEKVIDVVIYFFNNRKLLESVEWQQV